MPVDTERTLLIGFDGVPWDLLDAAIGAGALPHVAEFLRGSFRGDLRSVEPAVTIPAWYSAMTGYSPATLDLWGFTAPTGRPGRFRPVETYRPREAVWDRLGRKGWRVGVVNFPALPAPPVHGYFLSGMLPERRLATTHPPSLAQRLRSEDGGWDLDLPEFGPGEYREAFDRASRSLGRKAQVVETLQGEFHPDLLFVLFSETDRLQHDHWDRIVRFPQERDPWIRRYWKALDEAFHRVRTAFHEDGGGDPDGGMTWLLSDHGSGATEGYFFTNRFLQRKGYLHTRPTPIATRLRPWTADWLAKVDGVLPLRSPLAWSDHLRRAVVPRTEERDGNALDQTFGWFSRFVDWDSTRAFSFPVPEAIYANPFGRPVTRPERAKLKEELRRDLEGFTPARLEVVDPEELYGRPVSDTAPLLLLSSHGGAWEVRGDTNHAVEVLDRRPSYFQRQGTHRPVGILAVKGRDVPANDRPTPFRLLDVAPTLLALLGHRPEEALDGTPHPALMKGRGPSPPPR